MSNYSNYYRKQVIRQTCCTNGTDGSPGAQGPMGPTGPGGERGYYGIFYDQSQQDLSGGQGIVRFNNKTESLGITIETDVTTTEKNVIKFSAKGTYNLILTLEIEKPSTCEKANINVWLVKGAGALMPASNKYFIMKDETRASFVWNYMMTVCKDDEFQIYWSSSLTGVTLTPIAAIMLKPLVPSSFLTIQQVMYLQTCTDMMCPDEDLCSYYATIIGPSGDNINTGEEFTASYEDSNGIDYDISWNLLPTPSTSFIFSNLPSGLYRITSGYYDAPTNVDLYENDVLIHSNNCISVVKKFTTTTKIEVKLEGVLALTKNNTSIAIEKIG
jgi:hypothetical protein